MSSASWSPEDFVCRNAPLAEARFASAATELRGLAGSWENVMERAAGLVARVAHGPSCAPEMFGLLRGGIREFPSESALSLLNTYAALACVSPEFHEEARSQLAPDIREGDRAPLLLALSGMLSSLKPAQQQGGAVEDRDDLTGCLSFTGVAGAIAAHLGEADRRRDGDLLADFAVTCPEAADLVIEALSATLQELSLVAENDDAAALSTWPLGEACALVASCGAGLRDRMLRGLFALMGSPDTRIIASAAQAARCIESRIPGIEDEMYRTLEECIDFERSKDACGKVLGLGFLSAVDEDAFDAMWRILRKRIGQEHTPELARAIMSALRHVALADEALAECCFEIAPNFARDLVEHLSIDPIEHMQSVLETRAEILADTLAMSRAMPPGEDIVSTLLDEVLPFFCLDSEITSIGAALLTMEKACNAAPLIMARLERPDADRSTTRNLLALLACSLSGTGMDHRNQFRLSMICDGIRIEYPDLDEAVCGVEARARNVRPRILPSN